MGSRLEQKSSLVRKRIEGHTFEGENGEEYEGSRFGGFSDYFRRKKTKLQNLDAEIRAQSSDKPQLFRGVVCHVNGYTQPSLNDLHLMIVQHGGGFIQYLDGKTMVTHIIASNLTPKKKQEFRQYRVVKPAWVVDSISTGRLLPWDQYRVIDEGPGQKVIGFENGQVVGRVNQAAQGYREQTDTSWYTEQLKAQADVTAKKSQGSSSSHNLTPDLEDQDDEFSFPEITSSIEEALIEAEKHGADPPKDLLQIRTELETPPPTSPLERLETPPPVEAPIQESDLVPKPGKDTTLRARQGSQEPDYSMEIVRHSEVMRAVSPTTLANMTAEEHNALLLSDPKIRKSTVVDPGFLDQYYRESRLHHLSTWKANLKSQLQALAAEKTPSQRLVSKRPPGQRRYIMHVDFDSFFAAVSLKKHPHLKDNPVVVAHGGGSGSEIASCNYPARKYGINNGMWMRRAQELCPELKILPYDFPAYEEASRRFYDAIMATGGIVQSVSIDEALIDISALCISVSGQDGIRRAEGAVNREQSKADELAARLREEVLQKAGCHVSVGIGANILQAKVALRKAKPAGQYQLKPEDVLDFIGALEVQKLPGVAWSIGAKLEQIGIKFVKDVREVSKERLVSSLGPKTGEKIYEYARGIDKVEVGDQVVRKSVSAEVNWGVRFENQDQVDEFMHGLCTELHKRLVKERVKGKQLTMKVMKRAADAPRDPPKHLGHGKCDTFNKSIQLGVATNDAPLITKEAISMLKSLQITPGELRGIGVQLQKLEPLKAPSGAADQSSQRKLKFNIPEAKDNHTMSEKADSKLSDDLQATQSLYQQEARNDDKGAAASVTPKKQPLNMLATQFLLPTQVDPRVLAELPEDIRSKLVKGSKSSEAANATEEVQTTAHNNTRQPPKSVSADFAVLPSPSQIDPSILDALPEDLRNEVLGIHTSPHQRGGQSLLPQSPRKLRTLPPSKPTSKRGGKRGGRLFAGSSRATAGDTSTLTQSNFVSRPMARAEPATDSELSDHPQSEVEPEDQQPDPEFLAALPADLRREVLAQQRQARLQRTAGIDLSLHQHSRSRLAAAAAARKQPSTLSTSDDPSSTTPRYTLPARTPHPTFTSKKLSTLPDLRTALTNWFKEFSSDDEDGPYDEDIAILHTYLRQVVLEERNLAKAVAVVDWLGFVIAQDGEGESEEGIPKVAKSVLRAWRNAQATLQEGVQDAARERGLGRIVFEV